MSLQYIKSLNVLPHIITKKKNLPILGHKKFKFYMPWRFLLSKCVIFRLFEWRRIIYLEWISFTLNNHKRWIITFSVIQKAKNVIINNFIAYKICELFPYDKKLNYMKPFLIICKWRIKMQTIHLYTCNKTVNNEILNK